MDHGKAFHLLQLYLEETEMREGSVSYAGAIVQSDACIGSHCNINTGAHWIMNVWLLVVCLLPTVRFVAACASWRGDMDWCRQC